MQQIRLTTKKIVFLGLTIFLLTQTSHILSLVILPPLEPLYRVITGAEGLRGETLSIIDQWYFVFLSIGLLIIFAALFLEVSSPTKLPFIERNLKSWIPSDITSTDILKSGVTLVAVGLLAFNILLLLEPLPVLKEWSTLSGLLLVTGEAMLLGIIVLMIACLLDIRVLPGLDPIRRDLKQTTVVAVHKVQSTSKKTLGGISFLVIALLLLEEGLLLQRFASNGQHWIVDLLPFSRENNEKVIDPLLDFLDLVVESIGAIVNPFMASIGIDLKIQPLFKEGDWRTSSAALNRLILRNLGEGAVMTLTVSFAGLLFGLVLGTFCGTVRVTSYIPFPFVGRRISTWLTRFIQDIVTTYVEIWRGTPLMAQVFFLWAGVPELLEYGIPFPFISWKEGVLTLQPLTQPIGLIRDREFVWDILGAGIVALALNTGAYQSEIIRSGIQAIPSGQLEAARSLGLPYSQGMRYVVLPQAFRLIIPPLTNEFINLILNSSILSVISFFELTRVGRNMNNTLFKSFEIFGWLMICYFAMTFVLSRIFRRVEERFQIPGLGVT